MRGRISRWMRYCGIRFPDEMREDVQVAGARGICGGECTSFFCVAGGYAPVRLRARTLCGIPGGFL